MPSDFHREFLTVEDVASQLGYSEQYVRRLIKQRRLRAYRNGRKWRVSVGCLKDYFLWRGRSSIPL